MNLKSLKIIVVSLTVFFAVFLTGCMPNMTQPEQSLNEYTIEQVLALDITNAEYVKFSVPYNIDDENISFEVKDITGAEDREKLKALFSGGGLKEIEALDEGKGFDALIEIKAGDQIYIVINEDQLLINNKKYYEADEDIGEAAAQLYLLMDYTAKKLE